MTQGRVVIVGGHGKVALLAAPKLVDAGFSVDSLIRDPDHASEVERAGANPVVLDVEGAGTAELAEAFSGAAAVVFSAGAGGGDPRRTRAVDHAAAVRTMEAARQAGATRYVMVSYVRSGTDIRTLEPESSFFPYAEAKHHADEFLRGTQLDWTILGPGGLTEEPSSGLIHVLDADAAAQSAEGRQTTVTSRENVAEVIRHVLDKDAAVHQTVNFFDGQTPIAQAIG